MAGIHHVLIWARNAMARDHFWFGMTSWGAAGAAMTFGIASHDPSASDITQRILAVFCIIWLVATVWFVVEYTAGDYKRRRIAWVATLVLAAVLLSSLFLPTTGHYAFPVTSHSSLHPLDFAALVALAGLVIDGALRLWYSAQRYRAVVLSAGFGLVILAAGLQEVLEHQGLQDFPPLSLYAFLVVVCMVIYELATAVAGGEAASQRQRQELAHASRLSIVGELTASIAHEINQPLGAILSNADAGEILLENAEYSLEEIRQILGDIRRDGLRASDVIRHVRTLVRKRELELEKLDANVVASEVIALLEPEAHRRQILVASALSPQPTYLRGDRAHLEQVLINLVLNAMDAVEAVDTVAGTPSARAPIVLGVSSTSHREVEFQISDAGQGIPSERLSHLFDSFYTSKPHGMGLGLSIARSIVEAHGGRIRAENNRDAGATFRVTLPPYDELDG
jgi:signal transduction histidine kinase